MKTGVASESARRSVAGGARVRDSRAWGAAGTTARNARVRRADGSARVKARDAREPARAAEARRDPVERKRARHRARAATQWVGAHVDTARAAESRRSRTRCDTTVGPRCGEALRRRRSAGSLTDTACCRRREVGFAAIRGQSVAVRISGDARETARPACARCDRIGCRWTASARNATRCAGIVRNTDGTAQVKTSVACDSARCAVTRRRSVDDGGTRPTGRTTSRHRAVGYAHAAALVKSHVAPCATDHALAGGRGVADGRTRRACHAAGQWRRLRRAHGAAVLEARGALKSAHAGFAGGRRARNGRTRRSTAAAVARIGHRVDAAHRAPRTGRRRALAHARVRCAASRRHHTAEGSRFATPSIAPATVITARHVGLAAVIHVGSAVCESRRAGIRRHDAGAVHATNSRGHDVAQKRAVIAASAAVGDVRLRLHTHVSATHPVRARRGDAVRRIRVCCVDVRIRFDCIDATSIRALACSVFVRQARHVEVPAREGKHPGQRARFG